MTISTTVNDKRPRQIYCIDTPNLYSIYTYIDDYNDTYPDMIQMVVSSTTMWLFENTKNGMCNYKLLPK